MKLVIIAAATLSLAAASPTAVAAVARYKQVFIMRVDACSQPERCGSQAVSLLDRAETEFLEACQACAPADRCQADRADDPRGQGQALLQSV